MRRLLVVPLLLVAGLVSGAESGKRSVEPQAFAKLSADSARLVLAPVDGAKLASEDALRDGRPGQPLRYAVVQQVDRVGFRRGLPAGGVVSQLADGRTQWRLEIESRGAQNLSLAFSELRLPAESELWMISLDGKQVVGPLTDADNRSDDVYFTPLVEGSKLALELRLPKHRLPFVRLQLASVAHGYRDPIDSLKTAKSGSCNIDVACPEGGDWLDQIASVAHYTFQSGGVGFVCTGQLMATGNRAQDVATPRFSTAHHCVDTAASVQSMVLYWGFESQTCRSPGSAASGSPLNSTQFSRAIQSGARLLATHEPTDFTAVELLAPVPAAASAHYSGWDRSGEIPQASVGIHHPDGHEKRISFDLDPLTVRNSCIRSNTSNDTHWRVGQWEFGTTEPGSSGSGLWDASSGLLVGVLSGGAAACSFLAGDDCYGRLSQGWTGGGTPQTRMSDWFARVSPAPLQQEGFNTCAGPTVTLDSSAFSSAPAIGETFTISASASGGSGAPYTYRWELDEDGVSDRRAGSSLQLSYPRAHSGQITVQVSDSAGCRSTVRRALDIRGPELGFNAGAMQQACGNGDAVMDPGEYWRQTLEVENSGSGALPAGFRALFANGEVENDGLELGPDAYGYSGTTSSTGSCGFDFIDIGDRAPLGLIASGTFPAADDGRTGDINLGGTGIELYGTRYTRARMSTNGYVSFSPADTGGDFDNSCGGPLNNGGAGPRLHVLHDDLVVGSGSGAGLRYAFFQTCPRPAEAGGVQGCHVFQWSVMQSYSGAGASGNGEFQAVVYVDSNQIAYQYNRSDTARGGAATIGLGPATGSGFDAFCDNADSAPAGRAICLFDPAAGSGAALQLTQRALPLPTLAAGAESSLEVEFGIPPEAECGAQLALDYIAAAGPGGFTAPAANVPVLRTAVGNSCQVVEHCAVTLQGLSRRDGFYSEPGRSGNGLASYFYGPGRNVYAGIWYTAKADRTPIWYTFLSPFGRTGADLDVRVWRNAAAPSGFNPVDRSAGRGWIEQIDDRTQLLAWDIEGAGRGAALMGYTLGNATPAQPNHTQQWSPVENAGWGLAINGFNLGGNIGEFSGLYIYDAVGDPRWGVSLSSGTSGAEADVRIERPHCPGCPFLVDWESQGSVAGSMRRSYQGEYEARVDVDVVLPPPLSGSWQRSNILFRALGEFQP